MARSSDDITLRVGFDTDKFAAELNKTNQALSRWQSGVKSTLSAVTGYFSVLAIGNFVMDISRLAGEAEGVNAAFSKLDNSTKLMRDLKAATGGTVSELELMKRSVMASNFDISLKALPQLLEFATLRARQTGQSVDYLVDSIVTGIGRKSKLILDNLGISAVQLTEALGGASAASSTIGEVAEAVGRIASANLIKMGKLTDDAATRADRLAANWANVKVQMGKLANDAGISDFLKRISETMDFYTFVFGGQPSDPLKFLEHDLEFLKEMEVGGDRFNETLAEAKQLAKQAGVTIREAFDESTGKTFWEIYEKEAVVAAGQTEPVIRNLKYLNEQLKLLEEEQTLSTSHESWSKLEEEVRGVREEIDRIVKGMDQVSASSQKFAFDRMQGNPLFPSTGFQVDKPGTTYGDTLNKMGADQIKEGRKEIVATRKELTGLGMDWERVAGIMGESVGDMINGTQTFAQAMAQMASKVINYFFQMALAQAGLLAAKFGPAAPFVFAASAAVLGTIFSNIGRGNKSSGMATATGRAYQDSHAAHVEFVIAGDKLRGVLRNYDRSNGKMGI